MTDYVKKLERLRRYTATMNHLIRRAHAHAQLMDELAQDLTGPRAATEFISAIGGADALEILENTLKSIDSGGRPGQP